MVVNCNLTCGVQAHHCEAVILAAVVVFYTLHTNQNLTHVLLPFLTLFTSKLQRHMKQQVEC